MRSPGSARALDHDVATMERVTSGGTSGTTASSNTSDRYGSSLISTIGCAARPITRSISLNAAAGYTTPLGLLGEFTRMIRVRGVIAASIAAASGVRSGFGGTTTR